jgi:hypothetical protein
VLVSALALLVAAERAATAPQTAPPQTSLMAQSQGFRKAVTFENVRAHQAALQAFADAINGCKPSTAARHHHPPANLIEIRAVVLRVGCMQFASSRPML